MNDACRNLAGDVAAGRLSKDELDDLVTDLRKEQKRLAASSALEGVEAGIMARGRVIAEESALAAAIEKRNRFANIIKEARLMDQAERANAATGNPMLGLQSALVGINSLIEGAQRSSDSLGKGMWMGYAGGMIHDLNAAGLSVQFNNMKGEFEAEVADALSDLNLPEPTGTVKASADAKALAKIMHKYQSAAVERENRAGAAAWSAGCGWAAGITVSRRAGPVTSRAVALPPSILSKTARAASETSMPSIPARRKMSVIHRLNDSNARARPSVGARPEAR